MKDSLFASTYFEHFYIQEDEKKYYCCILLDDGGSDLKSVREDWEFDQIKSTIMRVCLGLRDMMNRKLVHCDIKENNILEKEEVFRNLTAETTMKINKLIDFAGTLDLTDRTFIECFGTPNYQSPEYVKEK